MSLSRYLHTLLALSLLACVFPLAACSSPSVPISPSSESATSDVALPTSSVPSVDSDSSVPAAVQDSNEAQEGNTDTTKVSSTVYDPCDGAVFSKYGLADDQGASICIVNYYDEQLGFGSGWTLDYKYIDGPAGYAIAGEITVTDSSGDLVATYILTYSDSILHRQ